MLPTKILVIPGSLRTGSLNARLAAVAAGALLRADVEVTRISLGDYPLPIYDGDLETKSGVPKQAINLARMVGAHHGVLIVSPEYNSSPPPLLKNALDWVTRVAEAHQRQGDVLRGRAIALASASDGRFGGARCLAQLRLMLTGCGAMVIPQQLALSFAGDAYDDRERLKHAADNAALDAMVAQLVRVAQNEMR